MAIREIETDTAVRRQQRIAKRRAVWDKTGGRCAYCGTTMTAKTFTIDHVTPRAEGGSDDLDNLLPACSVCNGAKGDGSLDDLRRKLRFKLAGMPPFSDSQLAWIEDRYGENIDPGPTHFWFERHG